MGVRERLGFAVAVAGQNLVYTFLGLYLLVYLYDTVGLSERAVVVLTATIAAIRVWDAVDDLLVGLVVDRTRTRWGTYRPYVLLTALPVALLTAALFSVPDVSEGAQVALVAVVYLLWASPTPRATCRCGRSPRSSRPTTRAAAGSSRGPGRPRCSVSRSRPSPAPLSLSP